MVLVNMREPIKIVDSFKGMHGIEYSIGKGKISGLYHVMTQTGILRSFKTAEKAIELYALYLRELCIEI